MRDEFPASSPKKKINSSDRGGNLSAVFTHAAGRHDECANWQTLDSLQVGNFESYARCVYGRAHEGITAQQELMRRMTDGAACLCQHSMEDSLVGSVRGSRGEERATWEPVLMGNVKRCPGGRV